jgi:hypothetical protein
LDPPFAGVNYTKSFGLVGRNYAGEYPQMVGVRGYIEVEGALIDIPFTGIRINSSNAFTPLQSFAPQGSSRVPPALPCPIETGGPEECRARKSLPVGK